MEPRPVAPVDVAITTLGRPAALRRCLRSLADGTSHPSLVVVVDQSDGETAREVVASVEGLPDVRYVPQRRRGLGVGQNEAVRHTRSDVVGVLDDDCVAADDWIAVAARLLEADVPVDLVAGRVLPLEEGAADLVAVSSRTSPTQRTFTSRLRPWDVGSGNNFALRRRWFDRVGGCDERLGPGSLGRGAVDIDLFYRLLRAGARVRYEPALVVEHERKSRAERLARRVPYGYGMGAASMLWLRERDPAAIGVLALWLAFRSRLLVRALRRRQWSQAWEETLVLTGTARGIGYGLTAGAGR